MLLKTFFVALIAMGWGIASADAAKVAALQDARAALRLVNQGASEPTDAATHGS